MSNTRSTIAKNASMLMISQVTTWGLTLLLMLFLPRYLGANGMGQLHLGNSIWTIVGMFITFGSDALLTKEIARTPERLNELLSATLVLRTILYVVGFGLTALSISFAGYSQETAYVIHIIGVSNFVMQYSAAYRVSLIGLERMEYVAMASIASRAFATVVSIVFLLLGYGVYVAAAVNFGAALVMAISQWWYVRKLQTLSFRVNMAHVRQMLKDSTPYLLVFAFSVIYMQLDAVIISLIVNEEVVGWYGVADQLFGTFMFVPTVFITAVFPALSRMYADASDSLGHLMRRSFNLLLLLSVPIGLGVMAIANPLVVLLFGQEFVNSGPVLAVMGVVLILTYQNILLGQFLISIDRQNAWTKVMAVATLATIPLDLVLVPWCHQAFGNGAIGGAIAFIITELGMVIAGLWLLPQGCLDKTSTWLAVRVLAAGGVMVTAVWFVRHAPIIIPIAVGAVAYAGAALLLRVVPDEDWAVLKAMGQLLLARVYKRPASPAGVTLD